MAVNHTANDQEMHSDKEGERRVWHLQSLDCEGSEGLSRFLKCLTLEVELTACQCVEGLAGEHLVGTSFR